MLERVLRVRFDYRQELLRKRCRISQNERFYDFEHVSITEVSPDEAPVAYRVTCLDENAIPFSYLVRTYRDGWWWPVARGSELNTDEFTSLAEQGAAGILGALGAPTVYSRQTIEQFEANHPIRQLISSNKEERRKLLHQGAKRTLFCAGQVFFEAGPPAYFRGPTSNKMIVSACGIGPTDFGNDGFQDCYIPGLPRHLRRESAATGQALSPEEIDTFRDGMPGWSVLAEVTQQIDTYRGSPPAGTVALFCEREFVCNVRLSVKRDADSERNKLLSSIDPQLRDWIDSECLAHDRLIIRRFAETSNPALEIPFHGQIAAARAILGRLKHHGLATELDEADESVLGALANF